jgi:hypothetical protein
MRRDVVSEFANTVMVKGGGIMSNQPLKTFIAVLLFAALAALSVPAYGADNATITGDGVALRRLPSRSAEALTVLKKGTRVELVAETNVIDTIDGTTSAWYQVSYGKSSGFVFGKYIGPDAGLTVPPSEYPLTYLPGGGRTTTPMAINPRFDNPPSFSDGLAAVSAGGRWGYVDEKGKYKIDPQFDLAGRFSEGLAWVRVGEKGGYINRKGKYIIEPQFLGGLEFSGGLAAAKTGDKWGYINKTGKFVIEPKFASAYVFSEGLAGVESNGKWGFVNESGVLAITPRFDAVVNFDDGLALVSFGEEEYGYIDKSGKYVVKPDCDWVGGFHDGIIAARSPDDMGCSYYDKTGKKLLTFDYTQPPRIDIIGRFSADKAVVAIRLEKEPYSLEGYIDRTGTIVIPARFNQGGDFSEDLAWVRLDGKYRYIDTAGNDAFGACFDDAEDFHEGVARVKIGGKWGYVDNEGTLVIAPQFDDAGDFVGGAAPVKAGGRWGLIKNPLGPAPSGSK